MTDPISKGWLKKQGQGALEALRRTQSCVEGGWPLALTSLIGMALIRVLGEITEDRVARHQRALRQQVFSELLPAQNTPLEAFKDPIRIRDLRLEMPELLVYRVQDQNGELFFFMESLTHKGYNGTIRYALATNRSGQVVGVRVLQHRETPGLGDFIERGRSDWILGFNGRSLTETPAEQWTVRRDGGDFDQFTGATVTPRSLTKSLAEVLKVLADHPEIQDTGRTATPPGDPNLRTSP